MSSTIFQPKKLFRVMTDKTAAQFPKEYEFFYQGLQGSLSMLAYLKVGDSVLTPFGEFIKVSDDLVQLKTEIKGDDLLDGLEKQKFMRVIL